MHNLTSLADDVASEDDLEKSMERRLAAMMGKEREYLSEQQVGFRMSSQLNWLSPASSPPPNPRHCTPGQPLPPSPYHNPPTCSARRIATPLGCWSGGS